MSRILCIETATRVCSVAIVHDNAVLCIRESKENYAHSSLVTVFAEQVLEEAGISFKQLDAIAVSKGPGSYTGLRIGVSTAKGFCYSLDLPLIAIDTLQSMAYGMHNLKDPATASSLYCPMIDARRMEVYCAIFDAKGNCLRPVAAEIITENIFGDFLQNNVVLFAGDGSAKCTSLIGQHGNALFLPDFDPSASFLAVHANNAFEISLFEDVSSFEPYYLKDFIAGKPNVKGLH